MIEEENASFSCGKTLDICYNLMDARAVQTFNFGKVYFS